MVARRALNSQAQVQVLASQVLPLTPERPLIGVDESNFSPSAVGDCVVAALAFTSRPKSTYRDSKRLTPEQRKELFATLRHCAVYAVAPATPASIVRFGIYKAREIAIAQALTGCIAQLEAWGIRPHKIVIHGRGTTFSSEFLGYPVERLAGSEDQVQEVAAASIVARVYVDALLAGYEVLWPGYPLRDASISSHAHRQALRELGPTPVHRHGGVYARRWWAQILEEGK